LENYIEITFIPLEPAAENLEIIAAFLEEFPLETFEIRDGILYAFGKEKLWNNLQLNAAAELVSNFIQQAPTSRIIPGQNWNAVWEENYFSPINIRNIFGIRAEFHPIDPQVKYDLVIQPKMSFGTGHHSTTRLMLQGILEFSDSVQHANVLDMGAGTGILAIAAEKLGAESIQAIDIETWAAENIIENCIRNSCKNITSHCGDANMLRELNLHFDIIFANIQKTVLLEDAEIYLNYLNPNGLIFLSGFYFEDLADIRLKYESLGCTYLNSETEERWCAAVFKKN